MSNAKLEKDVNNRLTKANIDFARLYKHVWYIRHLKKGAKFSVYKITVLSTHLFPPTFMACMSRGSLIVTNNVSTSVSTGADSALSLTSTGVTWLTLLNILNGWRSPASKSCHWRTSNAVHGMSSWWEIISCPRYTVRLNLLKKKKPSCLSHWLYPMLHPRLEPWRLASHH